MAELELNRDDVVAQLKERGTNLEPGEVQVISIRIKKGSVAKGEQCFAQVTPDLLNDEEVAIIWQLGLEARINSTGFSKVEKGDVETAMKVAAENIQKLYDGKLRAPVGLAGMKKKKAQASDRAITAEARRLARDEIKDRIRAAGEKVSHYAPKDINKAADAILEEEDEISKALWAEAEKVVTERNKVKEKASTLSAKKGKAIDLIKAAGLKTDPELVKKASIAAAKKAASKAKAKGTHANA